MGGNSIPGGLEKEDRQDDQSEFVDSIIDTNNDDSNILLCRTFSNVEKGKPNKNGFYIIINLTNYDPKKILPLIYLPIFRVSYILYV